MTIIAMAAVAACSGWLTGAGAAAAGTRTTAGTGLGAADRVASGGTWGTAEEVPGTAALNTGGAAVTVSVSCASPGDCGAGGYYADSSNRRAFVVSEANGTWGTAEEVPGTTALGSGGFAQVNSVSCGSPGNCSAGGQYAPGSLGGPGQAFVVNEMNGAWGTAKKVAAGLNKGGIARISSVSCASAGNCSAGGYYSQASGRHQAFVVSEKNGIWGAAKEVPGTAVLNAGGVAEVRAVSCASAGNCSAGGTYRRSGSVGVFVVTETNGTWGTAEKVPGIAVHQGEFDSIYSVSCGSAGNCSAGGYYQGGSGSQAFIVSQANGRWGTAKTVAAALNQGGSAAVESVSCASAGNCGAGGYYLGASRFQAFVVSEKHGAWGAAQPVPGSRASGAGRAEIHSVSCASAGNCSAGGQAGARFYQHAFVVSETNGTWGAAQLVPGLAALNLGKSASVASVSCASPGNCGAGGSYKDAAFGKNQAFVVSQTSGG